MLSALVLLLAISVHRGDAIRCMVCSSARDPSCKDPYDKTSRNAELKLTECSQDTMRDIGEVVPGVYSSFGHHHTVNPQDFVCVKAVTREYDREVVIRSCTVPRTDTFDICSQLKSRHLTYCQTCNFDSCNSAFQKGPASLWLLLLTSLIFFVSTAKY